MPRFVSRPPANPSGEDGSAAAPGTKAPLAMRRRLGEAARLLLTEGPGEKAWATVGALLASAQRIAYANRPQ